jgi:hypothetical protein
MYLSFAYAEQPALRAYGGAALQSSANYIFLQMAPIPLHHDLYNSRYFIAMEGTDSAWLRFLPGLKEDFRAGQHILYSASVPGYFQPVRITGSLPDARREQRAIHIIQWLDHRTQGSPDRLEVGPVRGVVGGSPQAAIVSEWSGFSSYGSQVHVQGEEPVTVGLSVTFHPLWRAHVDGVPAVVRRVTPDTMAVDVPPGDHQVVLRFRRPLWSWALGVGALVLLLLVAIIERRKRPQPAVSSAT